MVTWLNGRVWMMVISILSGWSVTTVWVSTILLIFLSLPSVLVMGLVGLALLLPEVVAPLLLLPLLPLLDLAPPISLLLPLGLLLLFDTVPRVVCMDGRLVTGDPVSYLWLLLSLRKVSVVVVSMLFPVVCLTSRFVPVLLVAQGRLVVTAVGLDRLLGLGVRLVMVVPWVNGRPWTMVYSVSLGRLPRTLVVLPWSRVLTMAWCTALNLGATWLPSLYYGLVVLGLLLSDVY